MKKYIYFIIICLLSTLSYTVWSINTDIQNYIPRDTPGSLVLVDSSGSVYTDIPTAYGYYRAYTGSLSGVFIQDILYIEDRRYIQHSGVDIYAKASAIYDMAIYGIYRGASTIPEQYIKNTYSKEYTRGIYTKSREAMYSMILSQIYTKDQILRMYLDSIYFGNNIYGISAAMRIYFSKSDISTLTPDESVFLLSLLRYPGIVDRDDTKRIEYEKIIRTRLVKSGKSIYTAGGIYSISWKKPKNINISPILTTRIQREISIYCSGAYTSSIGFSLKNLVEYIPTDICTRTDIYLVLSIDSTLQTYSQNISKKIVIGLTDKNVTNASVLVYDNAKEKIRAYIGNIDHLRSDGQIDMIQRERSVGSVLKPFLYLLALGRGAEIHSLLLDDEKIYPTQYMGKEYIPANYNLRTYGPVYLADALGNSLNMATVRLTEHIGLQRVYEYLKSNGLDMQHDAGYYGYGMMVGGSELTLENILYGYTHIVPSISPADTSTYLLQYILSTPRYRARTFGENSILNTTVNWAVKTGTSTNWRDNWAVGYHSGILLGVWVGNTDASSMSQVSGISGAGPIWHNIAEKITEQGYTQKQYVLPKGLTESYICMDVKCYQKQKTIKKDDKKQKTYILDDIYGAEDFYVPLNDTEKEKWNVQN